MCFSNSNRDKNSFCISKNMVKKKVICKKNGPFKTEAYDYTNLQNLQV